MSFMLLNAVRDMQVGLQEVSLYNSSIDGAWGKGCRDAATTLFASYAGRNKGNVVGPIDPTNDKAAVLTAVQTQLKTFGLYSGEVDGVWGTVSKSAFEVLVDDFRRAKGLPKYSACWSARVSQEFVARIQKWVDDRGFNQNFLHYLMAIMAFESAGTFDPAKQNMAGAQAYGLIQFMDGAAKDLNTTLSALRAMTQMQQLEYVLKYFDMRNRAYRLRNLEDFYLSVFYPKAIGMSADKTVFSTGTKGYIQNRGLDIDKDGNITVGEISVKIYQTYYDGMLIKNRRVING